MNPFEKRRAKGVLAFCLFCVFCVLLAGCQRAQEDDAAGEKIQIVLGTFVEWRSYDEEGNELPSDTERLAAEFNAQNDRYEIVLRVGKDEGMSYSDYYNRLYAELIAGEGPDLFCASTNAVFPQLVEKNVIEDLKPYIERDLNEDDYLKSILHAFERDGRIYALEHSFVLHPYLFDRDFAQGRENISGAEVRKILADHPEIISYNGGSAMSVLHECCMYWGWDPTDMEQLREYILFAEQYGVELKPEETVPGEKCLTTGLQLSQADAVKKYENRLRRGGAMKKGTEKDFSLVFSVGDSDCCLQEGNAFSINAASKNKEGAWEFIEFLLSREMQEKIQPYGIGPESRTIYHTGLPVRQEQFENALREAVDTADYTDAQRTAMGYDSGTAVNSLGTECLTEEEAAWLRKLAERSQVSIWNANSTPYQIVFEEISYYFNHTKSLDECMAVIENRIRMYLQEQG